MLKGKRPSKIENFMSIAKEVAMRSPCIRKYGAVLVKDGSIISTGYNGSVRGAVNCGLDIPCLKEIMKEPRGSYFFCPAVHSERNAIYNAARNGSSTFGSVMFFDSPSIGGSGPCIGCRRAMIQAGVKECYYRDENGFIVHKKTSDWIADENKFMLTNLKGEKSEPEK